MTFSIPLAMRGQLASPEGKIAFHRASNRSRDRAVSRQRRRQLRQRLDGDDPMACLRRRSSIDADRGAPSRRSSTPPWGGSPDTTSAACSRQSATSLPMKPKLPPTNLERFSKSRPAFSPIRQTPRSQQPDDGRRFASKTWCRSKPGCMAILRRFLLFAWNQNLCLLLAHHVRKLD